MSLLKLKAAVAEPAVPTATIHIHIQIHSFAYILNIYTTWYSHLLQDVIMSKDAQSSYTYTYVRSYITAYSRTAKRAA